MSKRTEFAIVTSSGVRAREEEVVRHASDSGVIRVRWSLNRFISLNTWVPSSRSDTPHGNGVSLRVSANAIL
jgi:hypothetical protein